MPSDERASVAERKEASAYNELLAGRPVVLVCMLLWLSRMVGWLASWRLWDHCVWRFCGTSLVWADRQVVCFKDTKIWIHVGVCNASISVCRARAGWSVLAGPHWHELCKSAVRY